MILACLPARNSGSFNRQMSSYTNYQKQSESSLQKKDNIKYRKLRCSVIHLHLTAQYNNPIYHQVKQRGPHSFPLLCPPSHELSAYHWINIKTNTSNSFRFRLSFTTSRCSSSSASGFCACSSCSNSSTACSSSSSSSSSTSS